jgi:hypothetical protein
MEISGTGRRATANPGGKWNLQKMCLQWQIKISWDVLVPGILNIEALLTYSMEQSPS